MFGDDWFAVRAEGFARFFGTPTFLVAQTIVVTIWNRSEHRRPHPVRRVPVHPPQPRLQPPGAYAAPLILLAQTRQADRDKAHADADAQHREALAEASIERQELGAKQSAQVLELLEQNTRLTETTQALSRLIKELTDEIHRSVVARS